MAPGDVLYLPPLWLHHVTAEDASVSVNVWQDSRDSQLNELALQEPIPGDADGPRAPFLDALGSHLVRVARAAHGGSAPRAELTVRRMLGGRWPGAECDAASSFALTDVATQAKADAVARHFLQMAAASRPLWLGDYLEKAAALGVEPENVGGFLACAADALIL